MYTAMTANRIITVDTMPPPRSLPDGTTLGYYSVTLPMAPRVKIVPFQYLKEYNGEYETETGFTRRFLKTLGKRVVRREEYIQYRMTRPPMYVRPSILKNAVYIDIKQAYPSIYKYLGWQTDYVRCKYWGAGEKLDYPYPATWKAGRSFVVSGARHLQFGRYVEYGRVRVRPYMSPFSNPPLVAGVYDVLSMLGRFSQYALQAIYWNVDGGIMPSKAAEIFIPFCASIGLDARIKHEGKALVMSSGYWKVGGHETKNFASNKTSGIHSGDYIPVDKNEAEWIYKHFRKIVERKI